MQGGCVLALPSLRTGVNQSSRSQWEAAPFGVLCGLLRFLPSEFSAARGQNVELERRKLRQVLVGFLSGSPNQYHPTSAHCDRSVEKSSWQLANSFRNLALLHDGQRAHEKKPNHAPERGLRILLWQETLSCHRSIFKCVRCDSLSTCSQFACFGASLAVADTEQQKFML